MTVFADALKTFSDAFDTFFSGVSNSLDAHSKRLTGLESEADRLDVDCQTLDKTVSNLSLRADGHASRIAQLESDLSAALARIQKLEAGTPTGGTGGGTTTPPPPPTKVLVQRAGPVSSTHDGEIISGLDISSDVGNALTITHNNVTVMDCRVKHRNGHGIHVTGDSVKIQNVEVINVGAPTGLNPESSENLRNINLDGSIAPVIDTVTLHEGSSGIYLHQSPNATIVNIEGFNFKGPMPRGQLVQFDKSPNGSLERFYAYNDPANSWPEDIVSVGASTGVTIKDGLIVGNNSVSGWGIMFEMSSTGGRVFDVDCKGQSCGSVCSYSNDVIFTNCRAFENIGTNQGRGTPSSGGLNFGAGTPGVGFVNCKIVRPGLDNRLWDANNANPKDVVRDDTLTIKAKPTSINHFWNP